jgi:hypothetical protein
MADKHNVELASAILDELTSAERRHQAWPGVR